MKKVLISIAVVIVIALTLVPAIVAADGGCDGAPWANGVGQYTGAPWTSGICGK